MGGGMARVNSRYELGNLVFYADGLRHRWVDAVGPNVIKYIDDFSGDQGLENWIETAVEAGSGSSIMSNVNAEGGIISLLAAGNDSDGLQIQKLPGFKATASDPIYFGVRWAIHGCGAGSCSVIMGLCIADTSLNAGMSDGIYFRSASAETTLGLITEKNSTEAASTAGSIVVDTYYTDEFFFDGAASPTVYHWHDGAYVAGATTYVCQDEALAVSLSFLAEAAHGENVAGLYVDWVRCIQLLATR